MEGKVEMRPPNIILILCDQFRGDCLEIVGHPVLKTPNLNYLAHNGVLFTCAYTAVPSCIPARATLWTGQNQWHTGILGMGSGQGPIPNDFPYTLAGELSKAGYRTHMIGKGHFHPQRTSMGFQSTELDEEGRMSDHDYIRWFEANKPSPLIDRDGHGIDWNSWHARPWHTEEYLHPTYWTVSRAINFLETRDPDRPFFLNISFVRPHSPYTPPKYYFDMYYNGETPKPHIGDWAKELYGDPDGRFDPNAWCGIMTEDEIHTARSGYLGDISFIDNQVGRLINWIRKNQPELLRNTWFIFTADHGDMQGDHYLWRKTYPYEGSTHIPLFITPPLRDKYKPNRNKVDEVVELRDIMPTVLDIAGVPIPHTVDGMSLLKLMDGSASDWREYIHGEHCQCYSPKQEMQYITNGKYKYVWLPKVNVEQFFDLRNDPGETRNLIYESSYKDKIEEFRGYLIKELEGRKWLKGGRLEKLPELWISPFKDTRRT